MAQLRFDLDAKDDLRQIVRYIGVEEIRPDAARKMAVKIYLECQRYARNPQLGESRGDILPGIRLFTVKPNVVFYFDTNDGIRIARIIHGARDYPALFS